MKTNEAKNSRKKVGLTAKGNEDPSAEALGYSHAAAEGASPRISASVSSAKSAVKNRSARREIGPLQLLLPYQRRWVDDDAKFKIGVQSRQTGKSFSTACEAVLDCFKSAPTKWVCLSAGERQALEWLDKCREWARAFRLALDEFAVSRGTGETLLKQAEIKFANGSRIIAIPANPSTARGYSANVVLDEFAYHEDPDAIWAAMFPSLTNPLAGTFLERVQALAKRGRDARPPRPWASQRLAPTKALSARAPYLRTSAASGAT